MTMFLAVLFALASALALLFAVLWLRALAAYEDRSAAFERAAADCVRLANFVQRVAGLDPSRGAMDITALVFDARDTLSRMGSEGGRG